jgi:hypothetical protein
VNQCSFLNGRRLSSEEEALVREGDELSFGCGTTIVKNDRPHRNPFVFVCKGLQGAFDAARLLSTPAPAQGPTQATVVALAEAAPAPVQQAQQAERADNDMTPAQEEVQLPVSGAQQTGKPMGAHGKRKVRGPDPYGLPTLEEVKAEMERRNAQPSNVQTGAVQGVEASAAAPPQQQQSPLSPAQQQHQQQQPQLLSPPQQQQQQQQSPLSPAQQQVSPLPSPSARRLVDLTLPAAPQSRPAANGSGVIVDLTVVSPCTPPDHDAEGPCMFSKFFLLMLRAIMHAVILNQAVLLCRVTRTRTALQSLPAAAHSASPLAR